MPDKPLAHETWQQLADDYARLVDTKPHNAFYDRPAVMSLLPDVSDRDVLDAGCGPGVYAEELIRQGARVVSVDASDRMLELARNRLGQAAAIQHADLSRPLSMFEDQSFDLVVAPLCLDYIANWLAVFLEFHRVLRSGGSLVMSAGHPSFDAEYFSTRDYFSVEQVECIWSGFGSEINMPSYRRSMEDFLTPFIDAGFGLERIHEPKNSLNQVCGFDHEKSNRPDRHHADHVGLDRFGCFRATNDFQDLSRRRRSGFGNIDCHQPDQPEQHRGGQSGSRPARFDRYQSELFFNGWRPVVELGGCSQS